MNAPLWVYETASTFWAAAGESEQFPRNLRKAIANALPLTVVFLPRLRASEVNTWLQQQSIPCEISSRDRALCACLVARYSHGVIFIDGTDSDNE